MKIKVESQFGKTRLDKFLLMNLPDKTRAFLQKLIRAKNVRVNSKIVTKNGFVLVSSDVVEIMVPEPKKISALAEDIKLNIVYEDKEIIVIDKPAKMVVHPSESGGHLQGTVVNAILHHCGSGLTGISGEIRPGIVHRLDKDTSGLLVIAKTDTAQQSLTDQFAKRKVQKQYITLVKGRITPEKAVIDSPIGRGMKDRKKMVITDEDKGRDSVTEYKLKKVYEMKDRGVTGSHDGYECFSLLDINLKTGRTHQIRVHMNAIGYPVVGDIVYGDPKVNKKFFDKFGLDRQFLHAAKLTINHPVTRKKMSFESKLPKDLKRVLDMMK